ncbi:MAG TPA: ABC transporter permease [Bacillota bacterium]
MRTYVLRRLLQTIPVLVGVSLIIFFSLRLIPGDPALTLAPDDADPETIEAIRARFGLDQPVHVQYARYMGGLLRGDWGQSLRTGRPVLESIVDRWQPTATLAVLSISISIAIGVPVGVLSAVRRGSLFDRLSMVLAILSICAPVFWIGIMMQYVFGVYLRWLPITGVGSWQHYILPSVAIASFSLANIARLTRAGVLEILTREFIRTARSKGVGEGKVVFKHALRNALIPVVTLAALAFGRNLIGSIVAETVFAIPGLGRYLIQAISNRDYVVVQGLTLVIALVYVLVNLVADLVYGVLDPRIRFD